VCYDPRVTQPLLARADASPSRDVREGGRWTVVQSLKNDALVALVRLALLAIRPLPAWALRALGRCLGVAAYVLVGRARRTALENLASVFPDWTPGARARAARRCFRGMGEHLGEASASLSTPERVELLPFAPGSLETLREALAEGRGVVFASAHLGPWERVAATLASAGLPFVTVAREAYDPRLTDLYDRLRRPRGVEAIYRGVPGAGARMLRALRRGGLLGVPMDLRTRAPSLLAPFLGRQALTPSGPARLALRTGAAAVVGTAAPDETGRLVVSVTRIPTAGLSADTAGVRTLTHQLNDELSRRIRALPEGWVWMHERW
jgi:KDO2-lipid IV(A) lauroyltransferase